MAQLKILVCVTGQKHCERLIREGAELAEQLGGSMSVVHVAAQGNTFLGNPKEGEALEYLFRTADAFGAEMTVLRASDALDTLVAFAREREADCVVVGSAPGRAGGAFAEQLRLRLPQAEIRSVQAHA